MAPGNLMKLLDEDKQRLEPKANIHVARVERSKVTGNQTAKLLHT